jgi:hypothetical protein
MVIADEKLFVSWDNIITVARIMLLKRPLICIRCFVEVCTEKKTVISSMAFYEHRCTSIKHRKPGVYMLMLLNFRN